MFTLNTSAASLGCLNLLGTVVEQEYPGIAQSLIAIAEDVPVTIQSAGEVEIAIVDAIYKLTQLSHRKNLNLNNLINHIIEFGRSSIIKSQQLNDHEEQLRWSVLDFRDFIFRLAIATQFPADKTYIDLPIKKRFGFDTSLTVELVIKNGQHWFWFASNETDLDHLISIRDHLKPHYSISVFLMFDGLLIAQ